MFDWVLNRLQASLVCVSYLVISMTVATLASCDMSFLKSVLYTFLVCLLLEAAFADVFQSRCS